MRKKRYLLFFCFLSLQSMACDMCGCGNGGTFFGMLPQSHRRFVGLRYKQVSFDSHLNSKLLRTQEVFQTAELWGRLYPFKKTQVLFFVPFALNTQTMLSSGDKASLKGLGDITLMAHYNLLNTFWDSTAHRITQSLMIGGGAKLPTGRYKFDEQSVSEVANANFQLGTGSVDFLANLIYTLRYNDWGLTANVAYKINTPNANQYRFGNRFTTNLNVFRTISVANLTLMPNAGLYVEHSQQNQVAGVANKLTGGDLLAGIAGIESYFRHFAIGMSAQLPLAQQLVSGEIKQHSQLTIHLSVLF